MGRCGRMLFLLEEILAELKTLNSRRAPKERPAQGELPVPLPEVAQWWNAMAKANGLPQAAYMTPKRMTALKARLKTLPDQARWKEAVNRVGQSSFLTGKQPTKDGARPWVATFDWFLRPGSVEKVLEGAYDDRGKTPGRRFVDL